MTTHQIPSKWADWQPSAVKAEELRLRYRNKHGDMQTGHREEDRTRPATEETPYVKYDISVFSGRYESYQWKDESKDQAFASANTEAPLAQRNLFYGQFSYTSISVTFSSVFNGNNDKTSSPMTAFEEFAKAAQNFVNTPDEESYRALNDAMKNLLDSRFTASHVGGNAQVSIFTTKNSSLVGFQMEVTPAPTKSLEEAREDLHKNYNEETYTNYIRALSEKFKSEGVISHTNHTPTTPVYKTAIIYSAKSEKGEYTNFRELKRPEFQQEERGKPGRFSLKNSGFSFDQLEEWQNNWINTQKRFSTRVKY